MNSRQKDGMYLDFVPFTTRYIEQCIFLYIFQGISLSPRIEMKYMPQESDLIHKNYFISKKLKTAHAISSISNASYLCKIPKSILQNVELTQTLNTIASYNTNNTHQWKLGY